MEWDFVCSKAMEVMALFRRCTILKNFYLVNAKLSELKKILKGKPFIIHYSCQSFDDKKQPDEIKITGITLTEYNCSSCKYEDYIYPDKYHTDEGESDLLKRFFDHLNSNHKKDVIYWHMTSQTYGFEHLKLRYKKLTNRNVKLSNHQRNLPDILQKLYPKEWELLAHPQMIELFKINQLSLKDLMTGKEEGGCESQTKLNLSRRRKVSNFLELIRLTLEGTVKFERR